MNNDVFNINIERFSGPYFKLLELIEGRKLSINEFSLSEITDEYLNYIKNINLNQEKKNIDISQFILVASTLMLIKAKSLFPNNIIYSEEEKTSIRDLENKLKLNQIIFETSKKINAIYNKNKLYSILKFKNEEVVFIWDKRLNTSFLYSIGMATLLKIPKKETLKLVNVRQTIKIEEVIEKILQRIQKETRVSFKDFSNSLNTDNQNLEEKKKAFIISFLAILELIKNGDLYAEQKENFEEINILNTNKNFEEITFKS